MEYFSWLEKQGKNLGGTKNTPGVGGPTPGGTAGGNYSLLLLRFRFRLGRGFFLWSGFLFCRQFPHPLSQKSIMFIVPSSLARRLWYKTFLG